MCKAAVSHDIYLRGALNTDVLYLKVQYLGASLPVHQFDTVALVACLTVYKTIMCSSPENILP